ncbi:hypothetical protein CC86DRAFT_459568, partial [Ophiobolus disseminans]
MPLQTQGKRRSAAQDAPVKRFRVSRACDQCRTERSKCDGNQPQCAPCFEGKRACTYTSNPRKRGLPPGYIRTIELALALVFQQNAEIEASLIARLGHENSVLLARDTKESNRLHKSWRKTRFCRELNKTLTGEQPGPEALSSEEESDSGEANVPFEANCLQIRVTPNTSQPPDLSSTQRQSNMQQPMLFAQLTALPPDCFQLLETYLTYTQSWFPICEKLDILKLSYSYPSQGLPLSPDILDSGSHAEMWSMLAMASCYPNHPAGRDQSGSLGPAVLYSITQTLIPNELGLFRLGHVKALLNLALFNLRRSRNDAAWLLVGAASRILPTIREQPGMTEPRRPHVVASCYLLDNLLALLLHRRSHMDTFDVKAAGKIEEDGLEEWQPWGGELDAGAIQQSRLPTLTLSSFNSLVEVVDILTATIGRQQKADVSVRDNVTRHAEWKAALPPKFEYVHSDSTSIPLTPPAALLQLTQFATALALSPSQTWLQRILELMDYYQEKFGMARLPPVIACLLESVKKSSKNLPLDQTTQARIDKTIGDFRRGQNVQVAQNVREDLLNTYAREQLLRHGTTQISPHSFPPSFSAPIPAQYQQQPANASSLLDDLLPDMRPSHLGQAPQDFSPHAVDTDFTSPPLDAYDPSISGDLDSFFDELASLHGVKKLQNQPQFMQNLGFAPEISMADLLATQSGQYMPTNTQTFGTDNEGDPLQFPLSDYYDAG